MDSRQMVRIGEFWGGSSKIREVLRSVLYALPDQGFKFNRLTEVLTEPKTIFKGCCVF